MNLLEVILLALFALVGYTSYKHGKRVSELEKAEDQRDLLQKYQEVDEKPVEDVYKKENW